MNIWEIREQLGLRECENGFTGVFTTGEFEGIYDYDAGLLEVRIATSKCSEDNWTVIFTIGTIDDGTWQAFDSKSYSKEKVEAKVKEIGESFSEYMDRCTKLPSEKELNDFLMPHGLWGEFTG